MNKLEVAVCDADEIYRNRFVTYLVDHKAGEIAVHAFSTADLFLAELQRREFDIALLGNGFEDLKEALREHKVPSLTLIDTMPQKVAEAAGYLVEDEPTDTASVFKFQPMESIIHEMQVLAGGKLIKPAQIREIAHGMEIIGIYSPVKHEMQMPFSMVFASILADKEKILYINLMEHSGFLDLFALTGEYNMEDIVIRLRNHRLLPEVFRRCVYEAEKVSYVPPFDNPENLHELTLEDFRTFVDFVEERTDFEVLVIDFGEGLDQFTKMLEVCSSIYCPVKSGYFFKCQVNRFLDYIRKMSDDNLEERLHMVDLPFSAKRIRGGGEVLKQLIWSEFGDYVRSCLMGEDYEVT